MKLHPTKNRMKNTHGGGRGAFCLRAGFSQALEGAYYAVRCMLWAGDALDRARRASKNTHLPLGVELLCKNFFCGFELPLAVVFSRRTRAVLYLSNYRGVPQSFVFDNLPKRIHLPFQFPNFFLSLHDMHTIPRLRRIYNIIMTASGVNNRALSPDEIKRLYNMGR